MTDSAPDRKHRILFMASQPFFEWRGSPIRLGFDAMAMAQNGFDVDFLTLPVGQRREIDGVRIVRAPNLIRAKKVPIGPSLPKFFFDFVFLFQAIGMTMRRHYDIVHGVEDAGMVALVVGRLARAKVVFEKHSDPASYSGKKGVMRLVMRAYAAVERFVMRHADAVIGTGPGLVRQVNILAPKTPATVISDIPSSLAEPDPDGVRAARARLMEILSQSSSTKGAQSAPRVPPPSEGGVAQSAEGSTPCSASASVEYPSHPCHPCETVAPAEGATAPVADDVVFATYVGSFASYQGIDLLFAAMPPALRKCPALRFAVIGGTPQEIEERRATLAAEGLADRVAFVGKVPPDELPCWLAASDIVLSPRIAGVNTPLKLLDYLKVGRAIVATDHEANRLILDEKTALLVPIDPVAFADGVAALASDPERREQIGSRGRRLVDETYNFGVFRAGLAKVHGSVLESVDDRH